MLRCAHFFRLPFIAFSEWDRPKKTQRWFALGDDEPLGAFAGVWRPWSGTGGTKKDPIEGDHLLFSFLTCPPNAVVAPIHPKTMPVILQPDEWETWLTRRLKSRLSCNARCQRDSQSSRRQTTAHHAGR